jgi:hypothetical protein
LLEYLMRNARQSSLEDDDPFACLGQLTLRPISSTSS